MSTRKFIQILAILLVLAASLMMTTHAEASSLPCGGSVTVATGDTLRKIADRCYTTVAALQLANGISNPNLIYVGQVLVMPGALLHGSGGTDIYIVNHGDTIRSLATMFNTTIETLLALNPGIANANLIYAGQRLNVPVSGSIPPTPPPAGNQFYTIQRGDTLQKIAARLGTSLEALLKANPQVTNVNLIYVGQKLNIPAGVTVYIVTGGDTLKKIADRFGTSLEALLRLNPDIRNANLIYVGQMIRFQ